MENGAYLINYFWPLLPCPPSIGASSCSELPMQDLHKPAEEKIYVAFCSHTDSPGVDMLQ
jgi:hypothetical protein